MHNCKDSKEALIEAALQGWIAVPDDFAGCARCLDEFHSLRRTVQMMGDSLQLLQPRENFWVGYDARLHRRLAQNEQPKRKSWSSALGSALRGLATTSVPVPAPLAITIFGFVVFSIFFLIHAGPTSNNAAAVTPPTILNKTIEVPVIHEKQITRIVYRDRRIAKQAAPSTLKRDLTTAEARRSQTATESLAGFTPVHEARLTLIKGSPDEK